jgi:hypothetical protein
MSNYYERLFELVKIIVIFVTKMNSEQLYAYIKNIKDSQIKFELVEISYGDRYYNEHGQEYKFTIFEKEYSVGYSYITEDDDDWAQAECHGVDWCRCDEGHIDPNKVYQIIINYKLENRDNIINKLLE